MSNHKRKLEDNASEQPDKDQKLESDYEIERRAYKLWLDVLYERIYPIELAHIVMTYVAQALRHTESTKISMFSPFPPPMNHAVVKDAQFGMLIPDSREPGTYSIGWAEIGS